ncbi:conserved hypothetical protein [Trichinella spiralis]|uniref:hypothetical protein n=1 Tax=Trichinella spiralis TaxID=6334 RepID=UPI0001EFCFEC|nr:conserved hypothetical protein [Trichinella spiralis]
MIKQECEINVLDEPRTKARKVERRWMTMAMVLCPSRRPSGQGRRCSGRRRRSRPSPVRLASVHCPEGEASVVEAGCRNFPQSSLRAVQSPSCRRETSTLRIPVYSSDLRVHLNKKEMFIYTKQSMSKEWRKSSECVAFSIQLILNELTGDCVSF